LALLLLSVATWSLTFGLLGAAGRYLSEPSPRLRYWADASYWIYLSHFPVMVAIAIAVFAVPMATSVQFLVLVTATLALVYPAYGAFVRHSAVGRILHGPRPADPPRSTPQAVLGRSAA
jgi:peptidoglycan/LPS O-acetylase OafA/YrhL